MRRHSRDLSPAGASLTELGSCHRAAHRPDRSILTSATARRRLAALTAQMMCVGLLWADVAVAQQRPNRDSGVRYDSRLRAGKVPIVGGEAAQESQAPIEIRLTQRFTFAPATVRSLVKIAPHPENRTLRVQIESFDYFRSSDLELEGERAAQNHFFTWGVLPPGEYFVVVSVLGPGGIVREVRQAPFEVLSMNDSDDIRGSGIARRAPNRSAR